MNALLVSHLALPHVGGVENLVDLELRALVRAGHTATLVTSDGTGRGHDPDYGPTVRVERVRAWHGLERRAGIPYPLFAPRLLAVLAREVRRADVVHAHGFLFPGTIVALALARLLGKPSILTDHGGIQTFGSKLTTAIARLGAETVGRLSAMLANRAVVYNARIGATLAKFRRRNDVEFLFNPVDANLFHPPSPEQRAAARKCFGWCERPRVLFVGRLIATKGVPLVLGLANNGWELVFCGPGDPAILGPLPRACVEYLPSRPQSELTALYHAADVLVLPAAVREGFPLVVQEALACGLPVVLGDDPGFDPYRGIAGLTFTDRSPADLRAKVERALAAGRTAGAGPFPDLLHWIATLFPEVLGARP